MKKFLFLSLLVFTCALSACGTGDSDGGGGGITRVSYTMDCQDGPVCNNASHVSTFTSGDYENIDCTWNCAYHDGQSGVYVSLLFQKSSSGCWEIDANTVIAEGICAPEFRSK